ncbi:MAG: tRNA (N(6)-L-threonylcarbamoyladenosine(37)-C(2))-methylthiotransferase MtaB [Lachnospiraceae bacterium]|nr:tRNA (N(6)-L-threonylcarbamoyladenosine(37)-C(2))-methylthiotransferase MtaB [Lachnospiraceae bacterium]
MKRVAFHNLGCKVNSYELDIMRQKMEDFGYNSVPFEEEADVYVINTCTVTNIADRKSRQMIHKAKKRNPNAVVIAVGCYVETDPDRVGTDEAIDLAIGNNRKAQIAELLEEFLKGIDNEKKDARSESGGDIGSDGSGTSTEGSITDTVTGGERLRRRTLGGRTMSDLTHRPEYEDMQLEDPGHTRAYVKIQDGCNQFCTYCIIPYARGRIRSRRPGEILKEIRTLASKGIREVVLTGIHVSSYGLEWDAQTDAVRFDPHKSGAFLLDLMQQIRRIPGIERIRLSSLEPRIMTEEFVKGIAAMPEVCPHFHLSLQSGCNATLRRMNRHYTTEQFMEGIELLRRYYESPAITTDVIVGFPGESNAEFEETVSFLEKVNFYEMHVFKYSIRKGTAAVAMPIQIPEPVKGVRSDILLEMTQRQSKAFRAGFIGKREEILLEEKVQMPFGLCWKGHTKRYVEGYIPCEAAGTELREGQLAAGTFTSAADGTEGLFFVPDEGTNGES